MNVIVDLDGTCSNAEPRKHLVDGSQDKDWAQFYDRCGEDWPNDDIRQLVQLLHDAGHTIHFLTGRVERVRARTLAWLAAHDFPPFASLMMRPDGDFIKDCDLKAQMAEKLDLTPANTFLVLDDRDQVVQMWRERGFRCLQVANGNF